MQRNILSHVPSLLLTICRAGALAVWFWLLLHMDIDSPEFFWIGESGPLAAMLPFAVAAFLLCDWRGLPPQTGRGVWVCLPSLCLLAALTPLVWPWAAGTAGIWLVCACAGLGLALTFLSLLQRLKALPPPHCAVAIGGGMFLGGLVVELLEGLSRPPLLAALVLASALAGLALPRDEAPTPAVSDMGPGERVAALLTCLFSGLGIGAYSVLWETFAPLPGLSLDGILLALLAALAPAAALLPAWRNGPLVLGVLPFAVVAYTAWPLLHRESPALSLQSLQVSYSLLMVWTLTLICQLAARRATWRRLAARAGALLLLGITLGRMAQTSVALCLTRGTAVNLLFLLLAVLAVCCFLAWSRIWQRLLESSPCPARRGTPGEEENGLPSDLDTCRDIFRQLGLTPQQALIAAMLAHKRNDADICSRLSISPATLKTHIRNILRRTGISSRHELSWLLLSASPARQERNGTHP